MKLSISLLLNMMCSVGNSPASPFYRFLGATGEAVSSGDFAISILSNIKNAVIDFVMNIIFAICKWALNLVDFFELIVKKMAGIDTMEDEASYLSLQNPIFKFLLNDAITKVFFTILALSVVLLIVLTVVAIVKAEYSEAIQEGEKVKQRVYKTAMRALFLFLIVPIVIFGSIMFSNAVLNGFYHALTGKEYGASTLGGQIFVASSYEANRFRAYAESGVRIPILINFDDPANDVYLSSYSPEELAEIYSSWTNGLETYKMFAKSSFKPFSDTTIYINNNTYTTNNYAVNYESFICTKEQYQVMADFMDFAVKNNVHFYYKCASDSDVVWRTGGKKDGKYTTVEVKGYESSANSLNVTYKSLDGEKKSYNVTYNLGVSNNSTPMQDALNVISQLFSLGSYTDSNFKYLSQIVSLDSAVDWTSELAIVKIDGVIKYYPVYNMTYNEYSKKLGEYLITTNKVKGVLLDNGNVFVRVTDEPILSLEDELIVNGEDYYTIYGGTATKMVAVSTDDGKIVYNSNSLSSLLLPTVDNGSGESSYYTPLKTFRKISYPEKLIRDLNAIYGNINIENFINTDSWSDALGDYLSSRVGGGSGETFDTSLIHPLGLIISEIFLGEVQEAIEGTSFSKLEFNSLYSDNMTAALIKTIVGEENYKTVFYQLKYFKEIFNMMMVPVLDELAYYEGFEVTDFNEESPDLYIYKAYLASQLLSNELCDYFILAVDEIVEINSMIEDLSTDTENAAAAFYSWDNVELSQSFKDKFYIEFGKNANGTIGNGFKQTIFWKLVYGYYLKTGKTEEEIDELLRNNTKEIDSEDKVVINSLLGLPEYINAIAKYVGAYVWDQEIEEEPYYSNKDYPNYFNLYSAVLKEKLLTSSEANEINKSLGNIKQQLSNFTKNCSRYLSQISSDDFERDLRYITQYIKLGDVKEAGFGSDQEIIINYKTLLAGLSGEAYSAVVTFVDNAKKLNQLNKYNLIYSLNVAMSEVLNGSYSIKINGKSFITQINMTTQRFKELVYGNQSFAKSLLAKLNSNIKIYYENLTSTEQQKLNTAVSLCNNEDLKTAFEMYKLGKNANTSAMSSLKKLVYDIFWSDQPVGVIYAYNNDLFWTDLYDVVNARYAEEDLKYVDNDYEGLLININGGSTNSNCFSALRTFLNKLGMVCFNLNNKTSFANLMTNKEDNVTKNAFIGKFETYVAKRKQAKPNDLANIKDYKEYLAFLGVEFDFDAEDEEENSLATLKNLRLAGMEVLGEYVARAQDSEIVNRTRYLELLYLVCADYSSSGEIEIDNSAKQTIMELAGLANRPDEELVGLEYTVNFENDKKDEAMGDVFILCTYDEEKGVYYPISNGSAVQCCDQENNYLNFKTSYMEDGSVIIAKGILSEKGYPTAIREKNGVVEFYRDNAVVRDAVSLGIGTYFPSVEDLVVYQTPISVVVNQVTKWITGETLAEKLLNATPRLWVDANLYLPYGNDREVIYHLDNGSVNISYNFPADTSISMAYLYQPRDLNVIILVFGTYFLITMIGKACFGVIKRIYDIVLLFLINPLVISTLPLTEMTDKQAQNSPYAKWRSMMVEKILSILGLVLGLTIFFIMANLINDLELIKEDSQIARDLSQFWIFKGKDFRFINTVMNVIFTFGAILLIESAPKLFGTVMGFGSIFDEGESVHQQISNNFSDVKEVVNGQLISDKIERVKTNIQSMPLVKFADKLRQKSKDSKFEKNLSESSQQAIQVAKNEAYEKAIQKAIDDGNADARTDPTILAEANKAAADAGTEMQTIVSEAAAALRNSYKQLKEQEKAEKIVKKEELVQRENIRKVRRGYITQDQYKKLEGRKKSFSDSEGKNIKKRRKIAKKWKKSHSKK